MQLRRPLHARPGFLLGMVIPFAVALVLLAREPSVLAQWEASKAGAVAWARQGTEQARTIAQGIGLMWTDERSADQAAVRGKSHIYSASIAGSVGSTEGPAPASKAGGSGSAPALLTAVPRMDAARSIDVSLGAPVRIGLSIENAGSLHRDSLLLVSNLPDYAALSDGYPLGAGTWVVPPARASELSILTYARPDTTRQVSFELVSEHGKLLAEAQTMLSVAVPAPERHVETGVSAGPAEPVRVSKTWKRGRWRSRH